MLKSLLMRVRGLLSLLILAVTPLRAERLPIRIYTQQNGLRGISVHNILRDSKGFLWFATNEGVSRYDGYSFVNYGSTEGLSDPDTYCLLETRDGNYWAGTAAGLYRLSAPPVRFERFLPPGPEKAGWVTAIIEDVSATLLVGTKAGLFRFHTNGGSFENLLPGNPWVTSMIRDRRGSVWAGTADGIYHIANNKTDHSTTGESPPDNFIFSLAEDAEGHVWAASTNKLFRLRSQSPFIIPIADSVLKTGTAVRALFQSTDGPFWAGNRAGLTEIRQSSDGPRKTSIAFGMALPLGDVSIVSLQEDRNRNLWIGTELGGAIKMARNGFITYGSEDGLGSLRVIALFEDANGTLSVITESQGRVCVNWFDGKRFHAVRLAAPEDYSANWLGWYQVLVQSHKGEWWAGSEKGLLRFPSIDLRQTLRMAPVRRYGSAEGVSGQNIYQIFEDSRGRLWISTRDEGGNGLTIRYPDSGSFRKLSEADGIPSLKEMWANGFFEDRSGQIWIGLHRAGLIRFARGRFQTFLSSDGVPAGGIRRFHQDRLGRLWVGSGHGGIARVDDPTAERPQFITYDTRQGLSGTEIQAITEDQWGRIYIGTGNVVDRLDPATGRIRTYTSADGLASGEIQTALRDRSGNLWFGTVEGISKLVPQQDPDCGPPPVRVTGVRVGGVATAVGEQGETDIALGDIRSGKTPLEIDYTGLSFSPGEVLHYQYWMSEVQRGWSQTTTQRSVTYARLSPGPYRFLVRAIDSAGAVSSVPAAVQFRVLLPFWMSWWFLSSVGASLLLALYAVHHLRLQQIFRVERLRSRLASDLHDEIGSGLSQIAVLSEMTRRHLPLDLQLEADPLGRVAQISRELLDSMNDLVWALQPRRDRLGDLTSRMRRFASESLGAANIEFEFRAGGLLEDQHIGLEQRRDIYLILREGIRNILRHSRCSRASVDLSVANGELVMVIRDDGVGFAPDVKSDGQGLASTRERARQLGGQIEWRWDHGTTVALRVPHLNRWAVKN
jgi:ligand-binding sensor domain-containing protein/two-component sensor histidine kinase